MLTKKQQQFFKLYYFHDLSMGEIAEEYKITRQAVHDIIKRSEEILLDYENNLKLFKKYTIQKEKLTKLQELLWKAYKNNNDENVKNSINLVNDLIDSII
jgi:hypothetical protein